MSEYFVLTAAHCFTVEDQLHSIKVNVGEDEAALCTHGIIWSGPAKALGMSLTKYSKLFFLVNPHLRTFLMTEWKGRH